MVPAMREEIAWVAVSSPKPREPVRYCFADEYLNRLVWFKGAVWGHYVAICDTSTMVVSILSCRGRDHLLINTLLATLAVIPFPNTPKPSSLYTLTIPFKAFEYANCCPGALAPSAHMRTRTTSAGLPIIPATPPAIPAQAMFVDKESFFSPLYARTLEERWLCIPNRAVEYVLCRRMEAERPVQRDGMPCLCWWMKTW